MQAMLSVALSVLFIASVAYVIIDCRRLGQQFEKEKGRADALDRIILLERQLFYLVIEEGALDLYDREVQDLLWRLIAAQKAYMEKHGVDWEASIARKMWLLREL